MNKRWQSVRLGEVLKLIWRVEKVDPLSKYRLLGTRWYGGGLFIKEVCLGQQIRADRLYRVQKGDFVYNRLFAWKGSFALAGAESDGCYVSNEFPCFEVDQNHLEGKFLHWYFRREITWNEALKLSTGATPTSRNRLKEPIFLNFEIPLPPLAEQRRVVARIEDLANQIQEARTLRHQVIQEADAFVAARISALFEGEIYWKRVEEAVSPQRRAVRSGPFGSQLLHEEFTQSGVAAIGTRDVQTNRFQLQGGWFVSPEKFEQFKRYQVFPGDLLCTIVGASIGRFCVVPEDVPLAFTTKHIQTLTLDSTKAEPSFVSLMLNFHRRCRESLFSQVEGSAQPSLNAGKILRIALPLPPLPEQRRIAAELGALQAEVDALKRLQAETAAELDALLPSILDKAFKGEL